jgi:cytochrome b pre-mRNA-processing protein 3
MLRALRALFLPPPPEAVTRTYIALVAAARNPFFYTALGVPDTLDGRFDMIVLHLFLLQHRLTQETVETRAQAELFSQQIGEAFLRDMDRSIRELGVADTGVARRMKAMGKAYHGRLQAYSAALGDTQALCAALARNLYGTVKEGDVAHLNAMAEYVRRTQQALSATALCALCDGSYAWMAPTDTAPRSAHAA